MKNKKHISMMGYRDDSPYKNEPFLDIDTPSGIIDMSSTGIPLFANGTLLPPYSGKHDMGTRRVREIPAFKGYMDYDPMSRGIVGGISYKPNNTTFSVNGVLPMDINPYDPFRGAASLKIDHQAGNTSVGIGIGKAHLVDPRNNEKIYSSFDPRISIKHAFDNGGESWLNKAANTLWDFSLPGMTSNIANTAIDYAQNTTTDEKLQHLNNLSQTVHSLTPLGQIEESYGYAKDLYDGESLYNVKENALDNQQKKLQLVGNFAGPGDLADAANASIDVIRGATTDDPTKKEKHFKSSLVNLESIVNPAAGAAATLDTFTDGSTDFLGSTSLASNVTDGITPTQDQYQVVDSTPPSSVETEGVVTAGPPEGDMNTEPITRYGGSFEKGGPFKKLKEVHKQYKDIRDRYKDPNMVGEENVDTLSNWQKIKNVANWRENLAENLNPRGYQAPVERLYEAVVLDRAAPGSVKGPYDPYGIRGADYWTDQERQDLLQIMLNKPQVHNTIEKQSKYWPTNAKENPFERKRPYYRSKRTEMQISDWVKKNNIKDILNTAHLDEEIENDLYSGNLKELISRLAKDYNVSEEELAKRDAVKNRDQYDFNENYGHVLGNYTMDYGIDPRDGREYISYYDKWNINPTDDYISDDLIDKSLNLQSPEIYGRVYLDEIDPDDPPFKTKEEDWDRFRKQAPGLYNISEKRDGGSLPKFQGDNGSNEVNPYKALIYYDPNDPQGFFKGDLDRMQEDLIARYGPDGYKAIALPPQAFTDEYNSLIDQKDSSAFEKRYQELFNRRDAVRKDEDAHMQPWIEAYYGTQEDQDHRQRNFTDEQWANFDDEFDRKLREEQARFDAEYLKKHGYSRSTIDEEFVPLRRRRDNLTTWATDNERWVPGEGGTPIRVKDDSWNIEDFNEEELEFFNAQKSMYDLEKADNYLLPSSEIPGKYFSDIQNLDPNGDIILMQHGNSKVGPLMASESTRSRFDYGNTPGTVDTFSEVLNEYLPEDNNVVCYMGMCSQVDTALELTNDSGVTTKSAVGTWSGYQKGFGDNFDDRFFHPDSSKDAYVEYSISDDNPYLKVHGKDDPYDEKSGGMRHPVDQHIANIRNTDLAKLIPENTNIYENDLFVNQGVVPVEEDVTASIPEPAIPDEMQEYVRERNNFTPTPISNDESEVSNEIDEPTSSIDRSDLYIDTSDNINPTRIDATSVNSNRPIPIINDAGDLDVTLEYGGEPTLEEYQSYYNDVEAIYDDWERKSPAALKIKEAVDNNILYSELSEYLGGVDTTRIKQKEIEKAQEGDEVDVNFEDLEKGIRHVESLDGILMKNAQSSATGFYGDLFDTIEYNGTRDEFAKDTKFQKEYFRRRFDGDIEDVPGLRSNGVDLYNEYNEVDHNLSPLEIAALSNMLGRQGTRKYLGNVIRDGKTLEEVFPKLYGEDRQKGKDGKPLKNKTPQEYLELFNKALKQKKGGEFLTRVKRLKQQLKKFNEGGSISPLVYKELEKLRLIKKDKKEEKEIIEEPKKEKEKFGIKEQIKFYEEYIDGKYKDDKYKKEAKKIFDKLNRVYYKDSKSKGINQLDFMKLIQKER